MMDIHRLDTIDSTNEEARRRVAAGAALPFVVLAGEQTAGRGTRGRRWHSPRGTGLYFSLAMTSEIDTVARPGLVTVAAGVACAQTLGAMLGADVRLKPINDLVLGDAKLGGILTEAIIAGDDTAIVVGVGINVRPVDLPSGERAASLADHVAPATLSAFTDEVVAGELASAIAAWIDRAAGPDGEREVRRVWARHALAGAELPEAM